MAKLTIHAGDFGAGKGTVSFPFLGAGKLVSITAAPDPTKLSWTGVGDTAHVELQAIEIASEESVKRFGGTVGWGLVGATLLGPVGLLAGLLAGGRGKEVTFVATFKDGKRLFATTDSDTYKKMAALVF